MFQRNGEAPLVSKHLAPEAGLTRVCSLGMHSLPADVCVPTLEMRVALLPPLPYFSTISSLPQ